MTQWAACLIGTVDCTGLYLWDHTMGEKREDLLIIKGVSFAFKTCRCALAMSKKKEARYVSIAPLAFVIPLLAHSSQQSISLHDPGAEEWVPRCHTGRLCSPGELGFHSSYCGTEQRLGSHHHPVTDQVYILTGCQ